MTDVSEYETLLTALTTLEEYSLARMVDEADALDADDDRRNKLFGDVATVQAFLNALHEFVEVKKKELDLRADTQEIFIERAVSLLLGPLTYKSQEG